MATDHASQSSVNFGEKFPLNEPEVTQSVDNGNHLCYETNKGKIQFKWMSSFDKLAQFVDQSLNVDGVWSEITTNGGYHVCKSPEVTLSFYPTTKTLKIQGPKQVYYRSLLQDIGGLDINNFKQETNPEALERDEEESFDASLVCISSQSSVGEMPTVCCGSSCAEGMKKLWQEIEAIKTNLKISEMKSASASCPTCETNLKDKQDALNKCVEYENTIKRLEDEKLSLITAIRLLQEDSQSIHSKTDKIPANSGPWEKVNRKAKRNNNNSQDQAQTKNDDKAADAEGHGVNQDESSKKRSVVLIGDSMIKNIQGWKLSTKDKHVVARTFPGSTVEDMSDYCKPFTRQNPEKIILHVGTNNVVNDTPTNVATKITNLAKKIKKDLPSTKIAISGLICRKDEKLNNNIKQVNDVLKKSCNSNNWKLISNHNIGNDMINGSGVHLNRKGVYTFASNLKLAINKD
ncbi:Transposon Ty3-G Gag-Pol poly [Paramuricea clavata]|uniref:Transposon Ty3-G Gag-Pol poly n=1 Tax=Paramuricea clavata TaxID=317549 RepID=A0A6S7KFF3_PARCT|nr:Transposon Ty3-G Gag-Pol poly [Paramuricea clavata]